MNRQCNLTLEDGRVVLSNRRFRLAIEFGAGMRIAELAASTAGDWKYDVALPVVGWAGFYGITGHTRDNVLSTEDSGPVPFELLEDSSARVAVRVGPAGVCGFQYTWTVELDAEGFVIAPELYVAEPTYTDNEVYLLALDCEEGAIEAFYNDAGFISPPREWFARPWPTITYRGNFDRSNYDLLRRWRLLAGNFQEG